MDYAALYHAIFRTDSSVPGFALVTLPAGTDLTEALADVREGLEAIHGAPFTTVHTMEFDQQVSTRLHRDGGPARSFLFLGYAPTEVRSEVRIGDLWRAAEAHQLTPEAFLTQYPPLSPEFERVLAPFVTTLNAFDPAVPQLLLINNSLATGVLHQATIPQPDPSKARKLVSWMVSLPD